MTSFAILAPDLEKPHERLLVAMVSRQFRDVVLECPIVNTPSPKGPMLSVGKAALDLWHDYGLIQVGRHRGNVFTHQSRTIMVLEHPGTLMQLSLVGHTAKSNMAGDLLAWKLLLEGHRDVFANRQMGECAVCARKKSAVRREAYYWPDEVDGVGLCEDHFRRMASLTRKPKKRVNPSAREAQIEGQVKMFG